MQINDKDLLVTRRAEIAIERLQKSDKDKVYRSIEKVVNLGLKPPYTAKLKGIENTFLVRAGMDLRIIFRVESEYIKILDVVRHDKLEQLSNFRFRSGEDL